LLKKIFLIFDVVIFFDAIGKIRTSKVP
jgi:hypothetical protein